MTKGSFSETINGGTMFSTMKIMASVYILKVYSIFKYFIINSRVCFLFISDINEEYHIVKKSMKEMTQH